MRQSLLVVFLISTLVFFTPAVFAQSTDIGSSVLYPASPFYFLKTVREDIEMFLAKTPRVKMIRQLEFATRRLREVNSLISNHREDLIPATLERYSATIKSLPDKGIEDPEMAARIKYNLSIHLEVLQKMYTEVSSTSAKLFIRSAINRLLTREDIPIVSLTTGCNFLAKVASSSALNEVEQTIYKHRAQDCSSMLH